MALSWRGDLESAVTFATQAAELAQEFIGRALKFDEGQAPEIDRHDASLVMYALGETVAKCKAAERAYFAPLPEREKRHAD